MKKMKLLAWLTLFTVIVPVVGTSYADNCEYEWERAINAGDSYRRLKPDNSNSNDRINAANEAYSAWKRASDACSGVNATRASDNAAIYIDGSYYEYCRSQTLTAGERLRKAMDVIKNTGADANSIYAAAIQSESECNGVITDIDKALSRSSSHAGKTYRCDDNYRASLNNLKSIAQGNLKLSQCQAGLSVSRAKGEALLTTLSKRMEARDLEKPGVWESIDAEFGSIINRQDIAVSACSGDALANVKKGRSLMNEARIKSGCQAWGMRALDLFTAASDKQNAGDYAKEESAWQSVMDASDKALSYCRQDTSSSEKNTRISLIEASRAAALNKRDTANRQKRVKQCDSYLIAARKDRQDAKNHTTGNRFAEAIQSEQRAIEQYSSARGVCIGNQLDQVVREETEAKQSVQTGACNRDFFAARQETELWRKALLGLSDNEIGQGLKVEAAWSKAYDTCTGEKREELAAILAVVRSRTYWSKDSATGMEFVFVKGGCYEMGDTFGDGGSSEKPVHTVCVNDFYMGKYEVTQGQWQAVMGSNPSHFKNCGVNCPVEYVSWNDVQDFIKKLNGKTGKSYRLPMEAEWEYAAREGGRRVRFGTGTDRISPDIANFDVRADYKKAYSDTGQYRNRTVQVGSFRPNSLGLFDMTGNVMEWCQDWYGEKYYTDSPRNNPQGPFNGAYRVLRGGSWGSRPESVRVAYRFRDPPAFRSYYIYVGFRLSLSAP